MAKHNQSLIANWLWPGLFVTTLTVGITVAVFSALWMYSPQMPFSKQWISELISDIYLWQLIQFTFRQASLSMLLSLLPAVPLALALYRRRFPGRSLFLRLCSMTLVLPALVVIFGLLSVYGQQGWLAQFCHFFNINYSFSIYGLQGILLAHTFFNLPLATGLLLQSLNNIPTEQRQLAAQLGMDPWQKFRFLEFPAIWRQFFPVGALIFMLCFSSFTVALSLGKGPQSTTIELAIYQALSYDFNPPRAALLALIQLLFCLSMLLLSQRMSRLLPIGNSFDNQWRDPQDNYWLQLLDITFLFCALSLLLPPIAAVIIKGLNTSTIKVLSHPSLWQAISTSVLIALIAGFVSVILSIMLIWSCRELRLRQQVRCAQWLELGGMIILAIPAIVLATGSFLLLINTFGIPTSPFFLIIAINAMMAIPYSLKILNQPMFDLAERYHLLCQSLTITGWNRLLLVELKALKTPLARAFAFACILSIGDFSVISVFGSDDFMTLPFYLYQQIGSYRTHSGAVTALLLLILCFIFFTLIEQLLGRSNDNSH